MRLIIAGSRKFTDYSFLKAQLYQAFKDETITEVISGGCDDYKNGIVTFTRPNGKKICGADGLGEKWASERNIPVKTFDADWGKYGKRAGPIRNHDMGEYASGEEGAAAIFHDGGKGSANMIENARHFNLKGFAINYLEEISYLSKNE